ncbi:hypothetical protein AVEN_54408-1 [Araneus ventricosus]|uniref:Uncharacterized protein n=1 Tax=Araneus ventricosus TaxID=182803 RepID=A0A4Y2DAY5_ARAVE|nr:hypothetical protein AVEN_54408-1 [Araneus ventricosus]
MYHTNTPSSNPVLASESTLNDRPPRLHRALWPRIIAHYERLMRRSLVLSGYDPSSESHTTITIPTREARTRLLIRRLLIRELAVPPGGTLSGYKVTEETDFKLFSSDNEKQ